MSSTQTPLSRRQFIGEASCAGVGATALFSTLLSLRLANSLAAQTAPTDYKALVCLFLAGGNDSFNMLVPTTGGEYTAYAAARSGLRSRPGCAPPGHAQQSWRAHVWPPPVHDRGAGPL
jgi:uncharacterized protein (DUF1501 family)